MTLESFPMTRQLLLGMVICAVAISRYVTPVAVLLESGGGHLSVREELPASSWYGTCVREARSTDEFRIDFGSKHLEEPTFCVVSRDRPSGSRFTRVAACADMESRRLSPLALHMKSQV
jgi:hypothetical protein